MTLKFLNDMFYVLYILPEESHFSHIIITAYISVQIDRFNYFVILRNFYFRFFISFRNYLES